MRPASIAGRIRSFERHVHESPYREVRTLAPWLDARLVKLRRARDHATRALGLLSVVARSGPAVRDPRFHRLLRRLGVLEGDTRSAVDSPLLERLPWGARQVAAPAPDRPPGVEGMWPQAPVFHPDIYPAVLHLDRREQLEHVRTNSLRYVGQIVALTPQAAFRARTGPRVLPVDDATFSRILTETSLGQHLRHTFNEGDRASFAPHVEGSFDGYAKVDFSGVRPGPALPGVHLTPTVTLFRRHADGRYEARAIRVGDAVFTPADGDAWSLCRYHALSGVHIQHTVIVHPRLHFPSDVINAVSKSTLPAGHVLARLILPHTRFTLGLDRAVTHHRRSVLYNSQREIYTALPLETEGICTAVRLGRVGGPDAESYPEYDFWGIEHDQRTLFGRYCAAWQAAFERFACEVTHRIPTGDPDVARWADAIAAWVPGFPDGRQIFADDVLGRAVGRYLASVTVLHSADHHSYAAIPIEYLPMRIRRPPPTGRCSGPVDLDSLVSVEDFFRHILNHAMFFRPVVVESLDEVRYGFDDDSERQAAERFRGVQVELDARWGRSGFPASYEIASSIQY
jgi:hypothetical protein